MRILIHTVSPEDEGRAVRSVVPRRFSLGEHAFRRLKVLEAIRVNGEIARASRILHAGDEIEICLPSQEAETLIAESTQSSALPASFIRYIDEDMIVVSKGAPLPTLPASHIKTGTLREQLCRMLGADPGIMYCERIQLLYELHGDG